MPNRLAAESSPYLLQHADNPVDWYPWSDEALERAHREDKPIFLSIGYAACHWCHVMEHESFEDLAIADFLNRHFVSIKVDREERPDLDQIYMQAVMALRGQGGWPLSAFLTPAQEVFFAGTYWPPSSRHGLPGFDHVLRQVLDAYRQRREQVALHAAEISRYLRQAAAATEAQSADDELLIAAARTMERHFDFRNGGFGDAPKFPHPMDLELLLRLQSRWPADLRPTAGRLREMVERNLARMAHGGIFDHLGGGFARYSVDAEWLVPHFEKMLYDNAQLAAVYTAAYRAWGQEFHAVIARKTLDYLLRDLRDPAGGFHSSEDADSEGEEGKFYVWSQSEIMGRLGQGGPLFCEAYGVTSVGNFEGQNILHLSESLEEFAVRKQLDPAELRNKLREGRRLLFDARRQRVRPGKDDKVLVNWNALAIAALAQAAVAFDAPQYAAAATECAEFIWQQMRHADGHLLHSYRRGQAKLPAFLDDYALLVDALADLYQATWNPIWLNRGSALIERLLADFGDEDQTGFYYSSVHAPTPIVRWREQHDSSVPSGNSTAAVALLRWGLLCQNEAWLERGRRVVEASVPRLRQAPTAAAKMLIAMDLWLDRRWLVVLACPAGADEAQSLARGWQRRWAPHVEFVAWNDGLPTAGLSSLADKRSVDGTLTAYICEAFSCRAFSCRAPIVGRAAIESTLEELLADRRVISLAAT